MTTLPAENCDTSTAWQARHAARWLGLAASPTFAFMACIAANSAHAICASASRTLPIDGMTAMYLLMSLFHLSPWLRLTPRHRHVQP